MSEDWISTIKEQIRQELGELIDHSPAIHDFLLHWHWAHWHPISTAPYNNDLELRILKDDKGITLPFPCRRKNSGEWINTDLGRHIEIEPIEWRVWQHKKHADQPV